MLFSTAVSAGTVTDEVNFFLGTEGAWHTFPRGGLSVQELVGTDPVCDGENLRRIGDGFERYGFYGEEDALVGVGGC